MLVQILTNQSERNQYLMLSIVFFIFIVYSLYAALYINLFTTIVFIIVLGVGVVFFMKKQLNNRTVVQLQVFFKTAKQKSLKRSFKWIVIPFVLYSILTLIHFGVVYSSGESLMPLFYDYGIGGVLAFGFNFYMNKNWSIGICNEGVIFGSKLDSKLIEWKNFKEVNYLPNSIEIKFMNTFPVERITISSSKELISFEKLLKYKINN